MTKQEIYKALIRGDGDRLEWQYEPNIWLRLWEEFDVLNQLLYDLRHDSFHSDNWRLRNVKDEQE
jgi:hypothetical protein